eukprot:CAMPEP_0117567780 /NCGR_PEP_ID=MMETSP0784-20121206/57785_1 /TAXON_ID=39447 /ORGANISM="" /LENGTH=32 /DNA_ID= /DNA_START= /DNA_END= /DNA_ORIENTATION=
MRLPQHLRLIVTSNQGDNAVYLKMKSTLSVIA